MFVILKVSKGAKIRNRYNQVPHLTQDANEKVTNSHPDTKNGSQDIYHNSIRHIRLGPRVKKKNKNGYPESSKDCYSINSKKYIWCIRNHCLASFSELHNGARAKKKYGGPCASCVCMRLIHTLLSQQRVIKLKSNYLSGMTICLF